MPSNHDEKALARYTVVASVLAKAAGGMSISAAISEVTKQSFLGPKQRVLRPRRRSVYRWVAAYKRGGPDALGDVSRVSTKPSIVLSDDLISFLRREKEEDPEASIPDVIRRAEILGIIDVGEVSRSTVWRAARKLNLPIFADKEPKNKNQRRFAYAHRMRMVLSDGKHFRAGVTRRKRVVLFFLDDCTRKVLAAVVGATETPELFLRGLMKVIRRFGRMVVIYLDNGGGFVAGDVKVICARIGIALIYGSEGYPEGHGKIERFNQTALQDLLRTFDGDPSVDPAFAALELRCEHYLTELYNQRGHESLNGRCPDEAWAEDSLELDLPEDFAAIERHFVVSETRRVYRDNVVKIDKVPHDMPLGYAGKRIIVYRDLLRGRVSVIHEGRQVEIKPTDLVANATLRRAGGRAQQKEESPLPRTVKTAARLLFERDFGSVVGPSGDFFEQPDKE